MRANPQEGPADGKKWIRATHSGGTLRGDAPQNGSFCDRGCAAGARLPKFVIIFMDDMGYADIGPFGAKDYPTPNLHRLAQEGRRFTAFYASRPVCSALRASLMTGCYNVQIGILGALGPRAERGQRQQRPCPV